MYGSCARGADARTWLDFDRLHEHVNTHLVLRQLLGHSEFDPVTYFYDQVMRNVSLLDEDTLRDINELVVRHGHSLCGHDADESLAGRCDSLVVETDVHYPTDRNLLWDAARVMVRIAAELADEWNLPGWRQARHHTVTLRRLYQRVANTRRSEAWRENVDEFLAKCEELLANAEATRASLLERGAWPKELEKLDRYIAHTKRQIDQTDRRILQGEEIPQEEQGLFCLRGTCAVDQQGEGGPPRGAGRSRCNRRGPVCQFILEHRILWAGSDTDAAVPVIEATRKRFPDLLACSFDRGFLSPQNQAALGDTLELNAMPAKGRLSASRREHEAQPNFALARQQHPAVESAINNLEQRGLDRVRIHIGIGGHLAVPPLPHHRAYGSVPRRFDRIKRRRGHRVEEVRASRRGGCEGPAALRRVLPSASMPSESRRPRRLGSVGHPGAGVPGSGGGHCSTVATGMLVVGGVSTPPGW